MARLTFQDKPKNPEDPNLKHILKMTIKENKARRTTKKYKLALIISILAHIATFVYIFNNL